MLGGQHRGAISSCALLRLVVMAALCMLGAPLSAALADEPPVPAEVLVVLASGDEGAVDASLSDIRALKHPPFNEYKTLKLLSRSKVQLPREQAVEIPLPNGRTLVLRLLKKLPDGRAKVQVSISRPNRPNHKEYLPLLEVIASTGEPFFVAGQRYDGGTLVLGIRAGDGLKLTAR
ncbi:MAG TPA: hypothetical protein VMF89_36525 [Polyangiales bacterium]|nr:hypothetical protein [Polyangiales bacterium]